MLKIQDLIEGGLEIFNTNGPNSSGKGIKGEMLELLLQSGAPHTRPARIVMSRLIDRHIEQKTPLGKQFEEALAERAQGKLMPDGPIFLALEQEIRLQYMFGNRVIILDGMPRNVHQAKPFRAVTWFKSFYIEVSLETCLARAAKRREESVAANQLPRQDDDPIVVRRRYLKVFEPFTLRAIKMLRNSKESSVVMIDGERPVREQITKMIKAMAPTIDTATRTRVLSQLDNPRHPATELMIKMEKPRKKEAVQIHQIPHTNGSHQLAARVYA